MANQQIFTDSHAKSILTTMNNLRKMDKLCDVTLQVDGISFPAHRIVLAACSDYFSAMFINEMSERDQSVIELHEISASVMEVLLDFVYTETVNVSVENVQELLPAACLLQLTGVKQACCTFLEKQLDSSNCLGIKIFAERHSCGALCQASESYSLKNFEEIVKQEEFKSLPIEEVERLIKSDDLQVNNEEPVFEAVVNWVQHDDQVRREWLSRLLQFVRLPLLTARYLTDTVDNEQLVKRSHSCRDMVDEAKKFHLRPDLRGQMNGPRMQPRAGTDDILVVLGGFGAHQNMVEVVEQYNPKTSEWKRLANLTKRRRYVAAAALNGKVYVIGGYDGQSRLNTVECLDLSESEPTWHTTASMTQRRGLAGVFIFTTLFFFSDRYDGNTLLSSVESYAPLTCTWELLETSMSTPRCDAGIAVIIIKMMCGNMKLVYFGNVTVCKLHNSHFADIRAHSFNGKSRPAAEEDHVQPILDRSLTNEVLSTSVVQDTETTYTIVENASQRGGRKLVRSDGFSYTVRVGTED
ncbi:hypothetical protein ScPMuIL_009460 [Solemya velum]